MAKNKNRLSFEANLSKHPHDLSAAYSASLATGQIIPQWFDIAQPGDRYIFKPKMFARLQNVVKAFLGEVDLNVKVFFVPMQMLYTPYGQIFAQTNDILSSTLKNLTNKDTYPMLNLAGSFTAAPQNYWLGHKECIGIELARLYDALDCNPYGVLDSVSRERAGFDPSDYDVNPIDNSMCSNPLVSPWLFAAYQAIYQKNFRNDEFEKFDIQSYNIDQYFSVDNFSNSRLIKLRYVQRPSDYFTKVRVSPITSAINKLDAQNYEGDSDIIGNTQGGTMSDLLGKVNSWLGQDFNNVFTGTTPEGTAVGDNGNGVSFHSISGFDFGGSRVSQGLSTSVASIRAAFALDKFLRIYGRAGKTYDEQILAHFGIKIPHDVKHDLTEICHIHGALTAEPIYATATIGADAAGSSVLGDVGGQGAVTVETEKKIKFTAPVHGVIMAVAYAVTKPRYFGTFSKLNLLGSRIDFPIPEFDKLGAQPLYGFECNPQVLSMEGIGSTSLAQRIGWQNRYQQFKEKYNRCSFIYAPADAFGMEQGSYATENKFRPWILSRSAFDIYPDYEATPSALMLWERPDALNAVMDVMYSGKWSNEFFVAPHLMCQTDPIITDFYMDCTKVSWMSPTGEPDL